MHHAPHVLSRAIRDRSARFTTTVHRNVTRCGCGLTTGRGTAVRLEARYIGRYTIWLRFRDGTAGEIDLERELDGPV